MQDQRATCFICHNPCYYCSYLLQQKVYHNYCYQRVLKQLQKLKREIYFLENKIETLTQFSQKSNSFKRSFKRIVLQKSENLGSLQPRIDYLKRDLAEVHDSKKVFEKKLRKLYDYWPSIPPDWSERTQRILKQQKVCYLCGQNAGRLEVRHKIPVSNGGTHEAENLIAVCNECCLSRNPKILKENRLHSHNFVH